MGNRLNASGGSKAVVIVRTKIRWIKLRECVELLPGSKLSLKLRKDLLKLCNALYALRKQDLGPE